METYYLRLFVYVGDSSIAVLETSPEILAYPVVIIECTFLFDSDKTEERLAKDGHIKWSQLRPYVLEHASVTFVLIHFSCRYKEREIVEFFKREDERIQKETKGRLDLSNCVIWACSQSDGTQKVNL